MANQYLRQVRVLVGDYFEAVAAADLLIRFDLRREANPTPAAGRIDIVNLNQSSETRVRERGRRVRLAAGYQDAGAELLPVLFDGDVRRVERLREGLDRVTRIHVGGNTAAQSGPVFSRSYRGVETVRRIAADIVETMREFELGDTAAIPAAAARTDYARTSPARQALTDILRPLGVRWYEDSGVIRFAAGAAPREEARLAARAGGYILRVSERTGLIGSPTITDDGVRFATQLDHRLDLDTLVEIESAVLDRGAAGDAADEREIEATAGRWRVVAVAHRGDNRGGEFLTEAEARPT